GWTLAQSNRTEAPKPRAFPWAPLAVATALAFIGAALAARSTRGASSEAVPSATAFAAADSQAPDPATARAALVATIERVLDGDNEARAPQEAGEAGQALNRLLDGLALVKERIDQKARVQALARLSSGLAHDLRHPVGNVKTFKGLLATEPNDATLMDEYLSLVDTEIDRVDKFVEGFSELARPVMYNPTRLAVRGLVEKCLGEIRPAADVKKVVILAEHAPDAMVLADEMHLGRAILEVLEFSLQATRSGGEIRVWTGEAPDGVAVEVRDAGQGTPLEGVEGIFDSYLTRGRGGGGLSLAMARRLVVEMGGRVSARTDGERGSLYRIVFAPMDHETPYDE
ncbi:HAMP domain-containing histidine kinase, partial [bacterium]|nr:HAMP domain-containing histidine kinase [bacterium]